MIKRHITLLFSIAFTFFYSSYIIKAQSSGGNLSIGKNGIVYVYGTHSFSQGSGFIAPGMITTSKEGTAGHLVFTEGSAWKGATLDRFVDGYVQVLHDQPFVFPIGDNQVYRPVAISGGVGTTAAYFNHAPTAIHKAVKNQSSTKVSTTEHWVVKGQQFTNISFTWGEKSKVASLTNSQLEKLTILGFKNGNWQVIASTIQLEVPNQLAQYTSLKGGASSLENGIITTTRAIIPSDYDYFTLGSASFEIGNDKLDAVVKLFPNPVVKDVYVDLAEAGINKGKITIYNSNGHQLIERVFDNTAKVIQHFNVSGYSDGLYELRVKSADKEVSKKFIIGGL